jgi:oligopeptide/dipeptide ABC transporter ATP-binding protein
MVFVTHDMSVVAEVTDRVAVMYGGEIAEVGPTEDVFTRSSHPYTIGLKNAFPEIEEEPDLSQLIRIPGSPPDLSDPPTGCRFQDRCPFATEECDVSPALNGVGESHAARCHFVDRADELREEGERATTWM